MKTKLCKPVLVEINEESNLFRKKGADFLEYIPNNNYEGPYIGYELILISLDPDDKIKEGDIIPYVICWANETYEYFNSNNGIRKSKIPYVKKVIATQDQIPPEYIQQFVKEYNEDEVKDVEIEIDLFWNNGGKYGIQPFPNETATEKDRVYKSKLTNGFITIVKEEPEAVFFSTKFNKETITLYGAGKFQEEKIVLNKTKASLLFIDLYKFLEFDKGSSEEPILYTTKEVIKLLDSFGQHVSMELVGRRFEMIGELSKWFETNKKK